MIKLDYKILTDCLKWLNYQKSKPILDRPILEQICFEYENDKFFMSKTNGYLSKSLQFYSTEFIDISLPKENFLGSIYRQDKYTTDIIETEKGIDSFPPLQKLFDGKIKKSFKFDVIQKNAKTIEESLHHAFNYFTGEFKVYFNVNVLKDFFKYFPADNLFLHKTDSEKVLYSFKIQGVVCFGVIMPCHKSKTIEAFEETKNVNFYTMEF
jgi:hypothetical protein